MKNMKKISLMLLMSFGLLNNAYALEEWPVADDAVRKSLSALSKQFENQAEQNTATAKLQENNTIARNLSQTMVSIMRDQAQAIADSTPDLNKCIIETKRMAGGGGYSKAATIAKTLNDELHASSTTTGTTNKNSTQGRVENKTCTEIDVQNNISGCTVDKIDPIYSGTSENIRSLLINVENGEGVTLADDQVAVAKSYINNIDDWLPQSSSAGKNNTEYTKKINLLKQDMSVVKTNLASVAANHMPQAINPESVEGKIWFNSANQSEYQSWFNTALPQKPSLTDKLRTQVWQNAYGSNGVNGLAANELAQLRKQNEILAQTNVLLYTMLEQQERLLVATTTMVGQLSRISYSLDDPSKVATSGR